MNIVLVHGGWHGGWVWEEVATRLRARGHRVFAPSLTGLAERAHLLHAVEGPDTHVQDIVQLLAFHELTDVMLVGHSYGGMVIAGAASRVPQRIAALIYLDAFVPTESGTPANRMANPERAAEIERAIQPDGTIAPNGFERWSASPDTVAWLRAKTTPHPACCFRKGVTLTGAERSIRHRHFILCEKHRPSPFWQFHDRFLHDPTWRVSRLDCLHDAMVERPDDVAHLIETTETHE